MYDCRPFDDMTSEYSPVRRHNAADCGLSEVTITLLSITHFTVCCQFLFHIYVATLKYLFKYIQDV